MHLGGSNGVAVEGVVANGHHHGVEACVWIRGSGGGRRSTLQRRMRCREVQGCVPEVDARGYGVDPGNVGHGDVGRGDSELRGVRFVLGSWGSRGGRGGRGGLTSLEPRPKPETTSPCMRRG